MIYRRELNSDLRIIVFAGITIITCGTFGYSFVEGWSLLDSLYMTVITLSTVGYGEVRPLTEAGRAFTVLLIVGGVGMVTYVAGTVTRMIIEGELRELMGRRRAMSKISKLDNHYIICGAGRIGRMVAQEFTKRPLPIVIIEKNPDTLAKLDPEWAVVVGDATEEQTLVDAGVERAQGLMTVLHGDADNLFVTLTARDLNPKLYIIARHEEERSQAKLLRAGADKVVSPYIIGGSRMAMAVLRPAVIDFIELATQSESLGLQMEEFFVPAGSPLAGVSIVDSQIRSKLDIIIVAIKKKSGHMDFNPQANTVPQEGDRLIAIGEKSQLSRLELMVSG